ncbi:Hypothetical_protein [Hexamita inflata]|uniref:Hypothetical_protein n=1 Tax=Hexamita inflata TaxID=28002 RepID=A0AA86PRA1_9EUKA|nr:Hypothetical protein HINF_LOCUS31048 [Hexamita inflata]
MIKNKVKNYGICHLLIREFYMMELPYKILQVSWPTPLQAKQHLPYKQGNVVIRFKMDGTVLKQLIRQQNGQIKSKMFQTYLLKLNRLEYIQQFNQQFNEQITPADE